MDAPSFRLSTLCLHRPKACVGALYFSQHRYDRELSPVCMGFRKRKANDDNAIDVSIPTDSVPGGDFKYMCIGYSAWDDEALRDAARNRRDSNDPVQLPYCEGLEVVSAAAINNSPELLSNGPQVGQQDGGTSSEAGQEDVVPGKKGRSFGKHLLTEKFIQCISCIEFRAGKYPYWFVGMKGCTILCVLCG